MNQQETEAAQKLLQIIKASQPSFAVSPNQVTITQTDGTKIFIPLSSKTILRDRSITSR